MRWSRDPPVRCHLCRGLYQSTFASALEKKAIQLLSCSDPSVMTSNLHTDRKKFKSNSGPSFQILWILSRYLSQDFIDFSKGRWDSNAVFHKPRTYSESPRTISNSPRYLGNRVEPKEDRCQKRTHSFRISILLHQHQEDLNGRMRTSAKQVVCFSSVCLSRRRNPDLPAHVYLLCFSKEYSCPWTCVE